MSAFTREYQLPLEQFRQEIVKLDPWFFWGFSSDKVKQSGSQCNIPLFKYAWQGIKAAGRADYEDALASAESRFFDVAGFHPAPKYSTKKLRYQPYSNYVLQQWGYVGADGKWMPYDLEEKKVQQVGIHKLELITANVAITRSDTTGDGLNDKFTLSATLPAGVSNPGQIVVVFSEGDRFGDTSISADTLYRWQVRPANVSISGTTATITGGGWLVAKPALYESLTGVAVKSDSSLDPENAAAFVGTLDVYRYYIDPTGITTDDSQGVVFWNTLPVPNFNGFWGGIVCDPTNNSLDPAAVAMALARLNVKNVEMGIVSGAEAAYNADTGIWSEVYNHRPPDHILIRFQAGYPLKNNKMDDKIAIGLARLAAAEAIALHCACEQSKASFAHWQFDVSRTEGGVETFGAVTSEDLQNPFGPRRGHIDCWKQIKQYRVLGGFSPIAA